MFKLASKVVKVKLLCSVSLLSTLLAGCAHSVDISTQQSEINAFIKETNIASNLVGKDEVNWWKDLHSAQLNQLVADALRLNNDLQTSQLQLQSLLARIGAEKAQFLPQGRVGFDLQRDGVGGEIKHQSSANVSATWQLDLFGRISALVEAAQASAMSQAEQHRLLQIEVVSAVVRGYLSFQGYQRKQHIIVLQVEALQQSINVLEALVEEGAANALDLNRTRAQLNQQQAILPKIAYAKYQDLSALAMLTGRLTNAVSLPLEVDIFEAPFDISLANPSNAIALRPDISRALFDVSQANALSAAASKALLPDVSLSAFVGILSLGNYRLQDAEKQWQVAPQIKWSLLSYPALLAEQNAQQLLSKAAYSDYQQTVLKAINESELALQSLVEQGRLTYYADQRYYHANNAFLQAQAMYEEGQLPYLALLDARQDVLIAQENAADSIVSLFLAKARIYQAFNGRWSYTLNIL